MNTYQDKVENTTPANEWREEQKALTEKLARLQVMFIQVV